jgi:hypothetical protein
MKEGRNDRRQGDGEWRGEGRGKEGRPFTLSNLKDFIFIRPLVNLTRYYMNSALSIKTYLKVTSQEPAQSRLIPVPNTG